MNQIPIEENFNFEKFLISINAILTAEIVDDECESIQKLYKLSGNDDEKFYFLFSHDKDDDELDTYGFIIFHDYEGNVIETILKPHLKINNFEGFDIDDEIGKYICYSGLPPSTKLFAKELIEHLGHLNL